MREVLIPTGAAVVLNTLQENGFDAYVVGGCVRDSLLGLTPKDWDICTSATPDDVKRCFDGRKLVETGIQHGTITVFIGGAGFEVTTFRTDGEYSDNRRPDSVEFVGDIRRDLSRRDFTMNAMAYNDEVGLVDPFNGRLSLRNKVISCVGNPDDRFGEDALRILRALRFASVYDLAISPHTAMSIHRNAGALKHIAKERINQELCKLLRGDGVLYVLQMYHDVMAKIIPELADCIGFNQNNRFHQYDVYDHIAHAVANYQGDDDVVNLALLFHDIGKPVSYSEDEKGGHFHHHNIPGAEMTRANMDRLRFDHKTRDDVVELVYHHDALVAPTGRSVRKWLNKLGEKQFFRLMDVRLADMLAHTEGTQDEKIEQRTRIIEIAKQIIAANQCFSLKDLAVNGNDVIRDGIPEGPMVGAALQVALDGVIEERVTNDKQELLDYIHAYMEFIRKNTDVPLSETEPFCPFYSGGYCDVAFSQSCYSCEIPMQDWQFVKFSRRD